MIKNTLLIESLWGFYDNFVTENQQRITKKKAVMLESIFSIFGLVAIGLTKSLLVC